MYAVYVVMLQVHSLGYHEDALVSRFLQRSVHVRDVQLFVLNKSVHALPYHPETLLNGFLEGTTDSHHLAHRLHRRAQLLIDAVELREVPTGNLTDHIVEGGFEESAGGLRHGVLQFEQPIAHAELGSNKSQRIARGLRRQGRRTRQTGVDLDDAIVL